MQINALSGMVADFVEFTGKKEAFLEHMEKLEAEREAEETGKSLENAGKALDCLLRFNQNNRNCLQCCF